MTLQHRHNFPGYVGPESSNTKWWHDAAMKHTKYPTAHEEILETREFTPGTRKGKKAKDPLYAFAPEYGPTKEEALYVAPPEYSVTHSVVKEAEEVVAQASKNGNLPRAMKI